MKGIDRPLFYFFFLPVCYSYCGCFPVNEAGSCQERSQGKQKTRLNITERKGMLLVMSVDLNFCGKDGVRSPLH